MEYTDTSPYFEWDEEYSVRNSYIDNQHKNILTAINKLTDAIRDGQTEQLCSKLHKALIAYSERHFKYEEELLEKYGYPELKKHKLSHQFFVQKVNDLYQSRQKELDRYTDKELDWYSAKETDDGLGVEVKMLEFLKLWFLNHILKIDKEFIYFLFVRENT